jgi:hypothetical protein
MQDLVSFVTLTYSILLLLNVLGFSVVIFYGAKVFNPIFIYLIVGLICEVFTSLMFRKIILIYEEETNAPFGHLYVWTQFIAFFFFFFKLQKSNQIKKAFASIFILFFLFALAPYLWLDSNLMNHDPYISLITMPCVLFFSLTYFIQLLGKKKGFPFINIGIFLVTGSSLISISSSAFYQDVNLDLIYLKNTVNLIPLILMQLLFMYECYLFFKTEISLVKI